MLLLAMAWAVTVVALSLSWVAPAKAADDESLQNPVLNRFYSELRTLFRSHYPEATAQWQKNQIHFEHDTQLITIQTRKKNGEMQPPMEVSRPKPGGILCDIYLQKGQYGGAAVVPQSYEVGSITTVFLAPYSPKQDVHLHVLFYYPRNVKAEFVKKFTDLVNGFGKYMD